MPTYNRHNLIWEIIQSAESEADVLRILNDYNVPKADRHGVLEEALNSPEVKVGSPLADALGAMVM